MGAADTVYDDKVLDTIGLWDGGEMESDELSPMPQNTVIYDIETTNLKANFGIVLCAVVKPLRLPPKIFRLDEYRGEIRDEDKLLVDAVIDEVEKYDFVITYNGIKFDNRYLNTRAIYHGLAPLTEKLQIDLLYPARRVLATSNKRLDTIAKFLDLEEQKTPIDMKFWRWAMLGDKEAMDAVVEHCIQDVKVLELVYNTLSPFIKSVRKQ